MKILAIETSCDETAVAVLDASGSDASAEFVIRGNALYSQAHKHAQFGGVYPSLAKREHGANLVPLLATVLTKARLSFEATHPLTAGQDAWLKELLVREEDLYRALILFLAGVERPALDAIAVTQGPGLEPALWVGVNFARALAYAWGLPIIPVNHLEGHLAASAVDALDDTQTRYRMSPVHFPALGLILSGGHTEFVRAMGWGMYDVVGQTRDDSIGEAFDKVARLISLSYPGGPALSLLAEKGRPALHSRMIHPGHQMRPLPRPMLNSNDLDFSFSGLKTAVLYQVREHQQLTDWLRERIAADFEDAVTDVVIRKVEMAFERYPSHTFLLGGGVSANRYLRERLTKLFQAHYTDVALRIPAPGLSTDNAVMVGMAAYLDHLRGLPTKTAQDDLRAEGNLAIDG